MLVSEVTAKLSRAADRWVQYRCQRSRPAADRLVAELSRRAQGPSDGMILCEALWDHPHHWLRVAMFRNALAPVAGGKLLGIRSDDTYPPIIDSLRSLGLDAEEVVTDQVGDSYLKAAMELLKDAKTPRDFMKLKISEGFPNHYLYDGILKAERLGTLDLSIASLPKYLGRTLQYLDRYAEIFDRYPIRAVVVSHPTNVRFSTLVHAAALREIPVYVLNYVNEHVTVRKLQGLKDADTIPRDYPEPSDLRALSAEQRKKLIQIGADYLAHMREGRASEFSTVNVYSGSETGKRETDAMRREFGSSNRPKVVVMANCWPDFPNADGATYFTDYQEWIERTLQVACELEHCDWFFKPHPAEHLYGDRVSLKGLLAKRTLPGHVRLWPMGVSSSALEGFADCVVTARGSAGWEYPAIGRRVIVAARTPFISWGFAHGATTEEGYFKLLRGVAELPLPTQKQIEDARIWIALTQTSAPETRGTYLYPWGSLAHKLWPGLPEFIQNNQDGIQREIAMMKRWLASGSHSYNAYKSIHADQW